MNDTTQIKHAAAELAPGLPERFKNFADAFAHTSNDMSEWALLLLGGSLLLILSTDYLQPPTKKFRRIYLLFIPGWICLGISVFYANMLQRSYPVALLSSSLKNFSATTSAINNYFDLQIIFFQLGVAIFSLWLISYLLWWIFYAEEKPKKKPHSS